MNSEHDHIQIGVMEAGSLLDKAREVLPANRLAAIGGVLVSIATMIATLQTNFAAGSPGQEALAKGAVLVTTLVTVLGIVTTFLYGRQKWDQIQHQEKMAEITGATRVEEHDPEVTYDGTADEAAIDAEATRIQTVQAGEEYADLKGTPPGMQVE